jgi:hypothetical protein
VGRNARLFFKVQLCYLRRARGSWRGVRARYQVGLLVADFVEKLVSEEI